MKAVFFIPIALACTVCLCFQAPAGQMPAPPAQPKSGPGGMDYTHQEVRSGFYPNGARGYWLFEPAAPAPEHAPVIVFNHGWSGTNPRIYGAWIEHLVRRGNIVIFPLYQDSLLTPAPAFTPNAIAAVTDALRRLRDEAGHVKPELDRFALVGHSMGGIVSANMAALWVSAGLPQPRALMCIQPGNTWERPAAFAVTLEDLRRIPKDTLLLAVTGDRDNIAGDTDAKRIYRESTQVAPGDKDYITLVSDDHGWPALKATHFAPVAPGGNFGAASAKPHPLLDQMRERFGRQRDGNGDPASSGRFEGFTVDALDFYGTWKLLDGLTDAAFYGTNRDFALNNTAQQRYMGRWSDGVPVKELIVTKNP